MSNLEYNPFINATNDLIGTFIANMEITHLNDEKNVYSGTSGLNKFYFNADVIVITSPDGKELRLSALSILSKYEKEIDLKLAEFMKALTANCKLKGWDKV